MKSLFNASSAIKVAILAAGVAVSSSASAAQFGVRIVNEVGQPVAGASVCFGLPGNYRQFGAQFTDANGQAMVEVPNIPFVVTVSKTRFSGMRVNEPARGFNLIRQVTLIEGTPGPRCKAGSTLADADQPPIHIRNVEISANAKTISLKPVVTGEPTQYRLSASSDMDSAKWLSFDGSIRLPSALAEQDEVHLQLRRYENFRGGWLEAQSRPVIVYLPGSEPSLSL